MSEKNYDIELDNPELVNIKSQATDALDALDTAYDGMWKEYDAANKQIISDTKAYGKQQAQLQQQQTDFAIEKIEQQREQAKKDYTKEQSGAYVDYQKQSNEYGVNAEQQAAIGMANTGYSESSQVAMYNTWQNRVAAAREAFNIANLNYDNMIQEAKLQNSSILAEIAFNTLKQANEYIIAGVQYKNQLLNDKTSQKLSTQNYWQSVYNDMIDVLEANKAREMQNDQYNKSYELQQAELAEKKRQFDKEYDLKVSQLNSSGGSGGSAKSSKGSKSSSKKSSVSSRTSAKATVDKIKSMSQNSSNTKTSGKTIDTKSVLALGRGPISGKALAKLEDEGKVKSRTVGNKIVFTPTIKGKYIK